jgi:hypothetical protein
MIRKGDVHGWAVGPPAWRQTSRSWTVHREGVEHSVPAVAWPERPAS